MEHDKVTQEDRTMAAERAQRYMTELRVRKVPYSFQPQSHGLVTVSTTSEFTLASCEAFFAAYGAKIDNDDWFAMEAEIPPTEKERKLACYELVLRWLRGHNGVSEQDKIDAAKYFEIARPVSDAE